MNVIRWLLFWPVAMIFSAVTTGTLVLIGGLIFGHWWWTACLVIVGSLLIQPPVALIIAGLIAPRINNFVAWSILAPYALFSLLAMYAVFGLFFRGYEGEAINNPLFSTVSPWWGSFSSNLGLMWGYGLASAIWHEFEEARKKYEAKYESHQAAPEQEDQPFEASVHHHAGVLQQH